MSEPIPQGGSHGAQHWRKRVEHLERPLDVRKVTGLVQTGSVEIGDSARVPRVIGCAGEHVPFTGDGTDGAADAAPAAIVINAGRAHGASEGGRSDLVARSIPVARSARRSGGLARPSVPSTRIAITIPTSQGRRRAPTTGRRTAFITPSPLGETSPADTVSAG